MKPFIYLRGLKNVDYSVFCVSNGQKTYYDPYSNKFLSFSSGQQVKRSIITSILEYLSTDPAGVTFHWSISKSNSLKQGEVYTDCDPSFPDLLLGGWMMAKSVKKNIQSTDDEEKKAESVLKRRSPLSISPLRPIHPFLSHNNNEDITFDRSDKPHLHSIKVRDAKDKVLTKAEIEEFLAKENLPPLSPRKWIPSSEKNSHLRTHGLFVYDVAIDLRRLFTVQINSPEAEISRETEQKLVANGWTKTRTIFGDALICPKEQRDLIIKAISYGLINWRITSNQSRTFSLMENVATAISDNANKIAWAIRGELIPEKDRAARLVVSEVSETKLFVTPSISAFIPGAEGDFDALEKIEAAINTKLSDFDYENQ